jgi:hypothetical protein
MFRAVFEMNEVGIYPTLKEAIKALWDRIMEGIKNRTLVTYQVLETTCWIEDGGKHLFDFYGARDYAYDAGWIQNQEWIN